MCVAIGKTLSTAATGKALSSPASRQTVTKSENENFAVISESLIENSDDHPEADSDAPPEHRTGDESQQRSTHPGTPFDWILDKRSRDFVDTMVSVRDRNLPQRLVDLVGTLERDKGEADCIKMLLCKSSPIVWGMQRSIAERIDGVDADDAEETTGDDEKTHLKGFFRYLPEMKEFREYGGVCELRYKGCELTEPK